MKGCQNNWGWNFWLISMLLLEFDRYDVQVISSTNKPLKLPSMFDKIDVIIFGDNITYLVEDYIIIMNQTAGWGIAMINTNIARQLLLTLDIYLRNTSNVDSPNLDVWFCILQCVRLDLFHSVL